MKIFNKITVNDKAILAQSTVQRIAPQSWYHFTYNSNIPIFDQLRY
jgi:hypothetical protein